MRTIGLIVKTEPVKEAPKSVKNSGAKKTKSENKKRVNSSDSPAS